MHQVLRQFLDRVQNEILLRPKRVLVVSMLLVAAAVVLGAGVEFRSSRQELAPASDPDQRRWTALLEEYRASEALIACVEAGVGEVKSPAEFRSFTDRLGAELSRSPDVDQVFHRVDMDWVVSRAAHLLSAERLEQVRGALEEEAVLIAELQAAANLADLNHALAARIERGFATAVSVGEEGAAATRHLAGFLRAQRGFLEQPGAWTERLVPGPPFLLADPGRAGLIPDGYLKTHDGSAYFLIISPRGTDDSLGERRRLLRAMRERAERVRQLRPGFRVAFTGTPAMVVDEMDSVRADTWRTSIFALVGVSLLTFLVFRWRTHALLVLGTLGMGVIWAFGAVRLELGYLNMITSSFISTLIGVGVAYGIHPVSEYELAGAHTGDPERTVRESFRRTGAGVAVAGITTSAAFFSILLMRFRGFSEMGLVAGVGVLLCLAAAMISLPAILVLYSRWRRERDRGKPERAVPVVDEFWVRRAARQICRFPRGVAALAALLTILLGWAALGLRFDSNLFNLLPRNSEALSYQRKLVLESDLSPLFSIVVADGLDSLAEMERRARNEEAIERFESVARFLPAAGASPVESIAELQRTLARIEIRRATTALEPAALVAALVRLEAALAEAAEAAFVAGLGEVAGPLEEARGETERSIEVVSAAPPERVAEWNRGQDSVARWLRHNRDWALGALETEPPTLDSLPQPIRERFLTRSGRPLGFLYPSRNLFGPGRLESFVAASRRVSAEATGFPVVFEKMSRRITSGFYRAVGLGILLVTAILFVDYRNPRDALLALVPLGMGVVWMMGAMRLLGISFNMANLVAVPLIIGVGIDNGVHVIHRVRLEGRSGMNVVLRHTGRAILIASMTTMIGFGSLALASHRGLASLGLVLLLGVGSCLITSTWVLPNLLIVLGLVER